MLNATGLKARYNFFKWYEFSWLEGLKGKCERNGLCVWEYFYLLILENIAEDSRLNNLLFLRII